MRYNGLLAATGLAILLSFIVPTAGATAETGSGETPSIQADNGAETIMIDAGSKPAVSFPHRRHQEIESVTCNKCHDLFPQVSGSIPRLKQEGTLSRKQVMKTLCISCHKETAKTGKPSGPTSCRVCHAN